MSYCFAEISLFSSVALSADTAHGLFGHATSLVCNRLMMSWKNDLNTALAAMELLAGLAKVTVTPPNILMCKRTVKWICDFIVFQVRNWEAVWAQHFHSTHSVEQWSPPLSPPPHPPRPFNKQKKI